MCPVTEASPIIKHFAVLELLFSVSFCSFDLYLFFPNFRSEGYTIFRILTKFFEFASIRRSQDPCEGVKVLRLRNIWGGPPGFDVKLRLKLFGSAL